MDADVTTLMSTADFEIRDFKCKCMHCSRSAVEYQRNFSITFIRKGNFYYNTYKCSLDACNGYLLINKPGYDYTITHVDNMPDECTIISFKESFYEKIKDTELGASWFFKDGIQSILLKATPELEYAHNVMVQKYRDRFFSKLAIESIVLEILRGTFDQLGQKTDNDASLLSIKKNHLKTIERAKEYMNQHLATDISLFAVADHCHLSPFHFSRVFKNYTHQAPYQYLQGMRLKQAELTLKNTTIPVTEVAFTSGFSSLDYFSAAFKHKYKASPTLYRARLQG